MTKKYIIKGLVQGIGYRPFVAKFAEELNIDGWVRNTGGIVSVLAAAGEEALGIFYDRLSKEIPAGGFINSIEEVEPTEEEKNIDIGSGFNIVESNMDSEENLPLIPADIATCDNCKKELFDENNRRFLHPFISCTVCGPRYSIIDMLPYDRDTISMRDFDMCPECMAEYTGKLDIRRHAQTIACKKCGPRLEFKVISDNEGNPAENLVHRNFTGELLENSKKEVPEIYSAAKFLINGGIVAIKDIGGYHLACDPFNEASVSKLRVLKHREEKAFAVMFTDLEQVREYCFVNAEEEKLLEGSARPIVLLNRRREIQKPLSNNVCLTSPSIGAMLPCNPLQLILSKLCGPLIMTSGNASGDVLETEDDRMESWLMERAASPEMTECRLGLLSHNRRILRPMDDSVMKVVMGRTQYVRRGRGHTPSPISTDITGEIFAAGGDLKASFCYVKNGMAYVSQYLGDMESVSCQEFYEQEQQAMERIFGFRPGLVAMDMHPGYFSRKAAGQRARFFNIPVISVQHHKAHVAAVIAEHKLKGNILGFAFDGTGYGDDGTIWGSEAFILDNAGNIERVAHLKPVKLIGGDEGARNCDTILAAMLCENSLDEAISLKNGQLIKAALSHDINTITSTSMGRLFDAVAALLDICHYNSYEGQAPIELENAAASTDEAYQLKIAADGDFSALLKNIVYAISKEVDKACLARGFIYAVSDYILAVAEAYNVKQIVLAGGTFLNRILLERTIKQLEQAGFEVYISEQLPPGDGSICLGQAYLAGQNNNIHIKT